MRAELFCACRQESSSTPHLECGTLGILKLLEMRNGTCEKTNSRQVCGSIGSHHLRYLLADTVDTQSATIVFLVGLCVVLGGVAPLPTVGIVVTNGAPGLLQEVLHQGKPENRTPTIGAAVTAMSASCHSDHRWSQ